MEQLQKPVRRQSNIELLRIICMLMIIAHHFSVHSGFDFSADPLSLSRVWTQVLWSGGKVGVDVFVLISGYFLVSGKSMKISKILVFWLQIFTYSAVIFLIFLLCGKTEVNGYTLRTYLLPVSFEGWWFVSAYFVMLVMSPFINRFLHALTARAYRLFLLIATVFWVLIPTVFVEKSYFFSNWEYNSAVWFLYLYALAGYIRLHGLPQRRKPGTLILAAAVIWALTMGITVMLDYAAVNNPIYVQHETHLFEMQSLPTVLISVLLLVAFQRIKLGYSKLINTVSSLTFGVYLLHDNKLFREVLWKQWVPGTASVGTWKLVVVPLIAIPCVFILGAVVEFLRSRLLERAYAGPLGRLAEKVQQPIDRYFRRRHGA